MTDQIRALRLAARSPDLALAARARAALREAGVVTDAEAGAAAAEQALVAADQALALAADALAGARLGDDEDLVARLESALADAQDASDAAARAHDEAQEALAAEQGRTIPRSVRLAPPSAPSGKTPRGDLAHG